MTNLRGRFESKRYYPFGRTDLHVFATHTYIHTHTLYTVPPTHWMLIGQVLDDHRIRYDEVARWCLWNHRAQVVLIWSPNCCKPYSLFIVPSYSFMINGIVLWKYVITHVACLYAAYNQAFYNCRLLFQLSHYQLSIKICECTKSKRILLNTKSLKCFKKV